MYKKVQREYCLLLPTITQHLSLSDLLLCFSYFVSAITKITKILRAQSWDQS